MQQSEKNKYRGPAGPIVASKYASRLGFWSAVLIVIDTAFFFLLGISTPARSGPFCTVSCIHFPYVSGLSAFIPADYVWLYPGFLLAPIFVVLMASIHQYALADKKIFSQIGLLFALTYATAIIIDYFIQFAVVEPSILSGESTGLSLFTQYNPHGLFIALEGVGYLMMSTALLFMAPVFVRGRLQRTIRWLYVSSFVFAASAFLVLSMLGYDIVAFEVAILTANWIVLMASGALLALLFRRAGREAW